MLILAFLRWVQPLLSRSGQMTPRHIKTLPPAVWAGITAKHLSNPARSAKIAQKSSMHYAWRSYDVNCTSSCARLMVSQDDRAVSASSVGKDCGSLMRTRFCRLWWPASRQTCCLLTAKAVARNACSRALALPSTGGAVRRILIRSPCSPANAFALALGCRWQ